MTFLCNVAVWVSTVMEPVGLEAGAGHPFHGLRQGPDDPPWKDNRGVKARRELMQKYVPDGDLHDNNMLADFPQETVEPFNLNPSRPTQIQRTRLLRRPIYARTPPHWPESFHPASPAQCFS